MSIIESIGVRGLQWVASPIVSRLINHGFSYVGMDVPKELTELETDILPKISLVMKTFPRGQALPELKPWLKRLKDAYYEAEDLLDEAEYQRVAKQVKHEKRKLLVHISSHPVIKPLTKFSDKVSRKLSFLSPQKRKLWRRLTNFRDIVKKLVEDAQIFHGLLQNLPQITTINSNETIVPVTSSLPLNKVFGRDEDRDNLVKLLLEDPLDESSKQIYSVVAIVGRGGAGKTTLAQYVFSDGRVVGHFDMRIWVCLKRKLDIIELTKEMIQSGTKRESPQQSNLDALQYELRKILLGSKNILVVLDDVWYNKRELQMEEGWERLMVPFTSIAKCKVLLTSRSVELPVALDARNLIHLRDLKEHELISIFRHCSHIDELGGSDLHDLEAIGGKIVARLGRSPLATKAVASRLRNQRDVNGWRRTLERAKFKDATDALMWSFQQLEEPLQRCFLYCSICPRGFGVDKVTVVNHWCALNFIVPFDTSRSIEEIGGEYFDELLSNLFIQPSFCKIHSEEYVMHDNFHDLAEKLARDECFRIEDDKVIEIPSTVRYLTVAVGNIKQHVPNICKLENLRSLVFLAPIEVDHSSSRMLNEIFGTLKKLRILVFYEGILYTINLPMAIGTLKCLKMLSIGSCSALKQVPESLSKLYNLQSLSIPNGVSLPRHMSNLINLQFIACFGEDNQLVTSVSPIRELGKMTSLRSLPEFHVKKEKGYEIQQLGQLRQLQGHLTIRGLENVQHKDEAAQAKLAGKMGLESLELIWTFEPKELAISGYEIRDLDSQVIDTLQPPSNLKKLMIRGYTGARYPRWFENTSIIESLHSVKLSWCHALEVLPSNLYSWRNCSELYLSGNLTLRELPHFPLDLKKLTIAACPSLVLLSEEDLHSNQQSTLLNEQTVIPLIASCIGYVSVDDLMILYLWERLSFKQTSIIMERDMSEHMAVFEKGSEDNTFSFGIDQLKEWWHCNTERTNFIYSRAIQENQIKCLSNLQILELVSYNITDRALSDCMLGLSSLKELSLYCIMSLTTLPSEDILGNLKYLGSLTISCCWMLQSLGALYVLSSLQKLKVFFCPCLDLEKENSHNFTLPSSLQSLNISMGSIPSGILNSNLPRLNTINFQHCRSAPSLSIGHLTSLRSLWLFNCRDICFLEGLELLCNLEEIRLTKVSKLEVKKSFLASWPGCRDYLKISSMQLLKNLFSLDAFVAPKKLCIEHIEEEITFDFEVEFERSVLHQKLSSVEYLCFFKCKTNPLPTVLRTVFSSLEEIAFDDCPELSSLPELPESVTKIEITGCPMLKERCRYNGEDWPKIAHIRLKKIE